MTGTAPNFTPFVFVDFSTESISANNATSQIGLSPEDHYKIGAILAIFGNFIIAVSLNVQKYVHKKRDHENSPAERTTSLFAPGSYLRSGIWWIGILLMILGEVGNFVAYGFAPASVVAPLGCVAVIANGALAVVFNNESLRMQDVMGASFAVVGGFLIIQFSEQADGILNAQQITEHLGGWQFIIYVFVEVITFGLIIFARSYKHYENHGVTLQLILVAILGSFTVISAKAVSGMLALSIEGDFQFIYLVFYVMLAIMVVTTILQVKYLNEAMAKYDIATVVPINFVLFTISAIVAGAIFYQEFFNRSGITILMFLFGCSLSFVGVVFLTWDKNKFEIESTSLRLDMMPNFIRSLAPTMKTLTVQPKPNHKQVLSYPDEEAVPLLENDTNSVTRCMGSLDAVESTSRINQKVSINYQVSRNTVSSCSGTEDFTDWDSTTGSEDEIANEGSNLATDDKQTTQLP